MWYEGDKLRNKLLLCCAVLLGELEGCLPRIPKDVHSGDRQHRGTVSDSERES